MASLNDRLRFPDDRTSFIYQGAYQPILTPPITSVTIYADQGATALADILDTSGNPILGAVLHTNASGLLPEFYGPVGNVAQLWAVVSSSTPYPMTAQFSGQLALLPTILTGHGAPTGLMAVSGSLYLDTAAMALYGPYGGQGWGSPQSLVGPAGASPLTSATGVVIDPSARWTLAHNLGFYPAAVWCEDTQGNQLLSGNVAWPDINTVTVDWSQLEAGQWKVS